MPEGVGSKKKTGSTALQIGWSTFFNEHARSSVPFHTEYAIRALRITEVDGKFCKFLPSGIFPEM